jgi:RNA polymerase sigma-70 factor (ECF subfamily)
MTISDEALMLGVQKGDVKAFDLLVKRWEKPLLSHCHRMVNDLSLAEDLRQEVFIRVYRSAKTYEVTAKFSTWIYRIATNLCLDTLAKQRRRKEVPIAVYTEPEPQTVDENLIDPAQRPDEATTKKELESQVRWALSRLPEEQRQVVVMRHYDGLKFHEIAEILSCPVSTVKSRMAIAIQRLGQMLSRQEWF